MIKKLNLTIANSYLIQTSKSIIVDTGAPNSAKRILKLISKYGVNAKEIALILLTHAHSDHAGSAKELRELTGAPIAVHQDDVSMLKQGHNGDMLPLGLEAKFSQMFVDKPFPAIEPDIVLRSGNELADFDIPAQILHTPGHSAGSISLIFENGDSIVGDILRGGLMGGTFLSNQPKYPYFLYDMADKTILHQSIHSVLNTGTRQFYVGHGGSLARNDIEAWLSKNLHEARRIQSL